MMQMIGKDSHDIAWYAKCGYEIKHSSFTIRSAIEADNAGRRLSSGFAWTPTLCFFDCVVGAPRPGFRSPFNRCNRSSLAARSLLFPNKVGAFSFIFGISISKWPVTFDRFAVDSDAFTSLGNFKRSTLLLITTET